MVVSVWEDELPVDADVKVNSYILSGGQFGSMYAIFSILHIM
jgi:hypothetical protein